MERENDENPELRSRDLTSSLHSTSSHWPYQHGQVNLPVSVSFLLGSDNRHYTKLAMSIKWTNILKVFK